MATTLLQLRDRAKALSDMQDTDFITDATWNDWINVAITELYSQLVVTFEDYFIESLEFPLVVGTAAYDLPADFFKARKVFRKVGTKKHRVPRMQMIDMEDSNYIYMKQLRYRIMKDSIWFDGVRSADTIILYYIPTPTLLEDDTDEINFNIPLLGWTEYITVSAGIQALTKEESNTSVLAARKQELRALIKNSAEQRDVGEPNRVQKVGYRRY